MKTNESQHENNVNFMKIFSVSRETNACQVKFYENFLHFWENYFHKIFIKFSLTNCVGYGIIKIRAAASVSGPPNLSRVFYEKKRNFFRKKFQNQEFAFPLSKVRRFSDWLTPIPYRQMGPALLTLRGLRSLSYSKIQSQ